MELLENRVAIITGGTGALGRAVAEHFLIAGAKVAILYVIDAEVPLLNKQLDKRFPEAQMLLKKVDVSDEARAAKFVEEVAAKFGKIDILANLVGGFWGDKPNRRDQHRRVAGNVRPQREADFHLLSRGGANNAAQQVGADHFGNVAIRPAGSLLLFGLRRGEGCDRDFHGVARAGSARGWRTGERGCGRTKHDRHGGESRLDAEGQA